jgi:integrase
MNNSTPDRRSPLALFPGQPTPRLPVIQRAVPGAVLRAGVAGRATGHTVRHSFAAHLPQDGYDIRTVQELLGRPGVKATMAYPGVLDGGGRGVRTPSTGCREPGPASVAGLSGLTGRLKTGTKVIGPGGSR